MPLTDLDCRAAKPQEKPYKLTDSSGMFLLVSPNGGRWWRLKYRFAGKEKLLSLGTYPSTSLKEARLARDQARALLSTGVDPGTERKKQKLALHEANASSFEVVATEWFERHGPASESGRKKTLWFLAFANKSFGKKPITEVTPSDILSVCREQEALGHIETAHRIRAKCSQVFRYAIATDRLQHEPTAALRGALKPIRVKHRPAITEPAELGPLIRAMRDYNGTVVTRAALALAPLVFIRPGELRGAQWEHVDLGKAIWAYTPPKTRNQTGVEHIIPLPRQAVAILRDLHAVTGHGPHLFPGQGKRGSVMSENTINQALRRMGYDTSTEICGHGFRAVARTILDEVLGFRPELIEQQLAHQVRDMHGRAYNRTKHLPERARMMQAWADYLDDLAASRATKTLTDTPQ